MSNPLPEVPLFTPDFLDALAEALDARRAQDRSRPPLMQNGQWLPARPS